MQLCAGGCFSEAIAKKIKSASVWKQKPAEGQLHLVQVCIYILVESINLQIHTRNLSPRLCQLVTHGLTNAIE